MIIDLAKKHERTSIRPVESVNIPMSPELIAGLSLLSPFISDVQMIGECYIYVYLSALSRDSLSMVNYNHLSKLGWWYESDHGPPQNADRSEKWVWMK